MVEATSSEDNEEAKKWFDQGNQKLEQGDFLGAIASYERAIEVQPNDPKGYNNRGVALSGLDRYEEAIASYERAIELQPDYPEAYFNQGIVLRNLGRYQEAICNYNRTIELQHNHLKAYINKGLIQCDFLDLYEEAIASFDRAIELKTNHPDPHYNRGVALGNLGRYEEAIASFDRAIELKPEYFAAYNNRGNALNNLGRYEEAIASFDHAIKLKRGYPYAWLNRGNAAGISALPDPLLTFMSVIAPENHQLKQRGYKGRLASYKAGLKYCPQDRYPEGWGLLNQHIGKAHYNHGRREVQPASYYRQAEISHNEALKTLTENAFPERHLGVLQDLIEVLFSLRRNAEAAEILRRGSDLLRKLVKQYQQTRHENAVQQLQLKFAGFKQLTVDLFCQQDEWVKAWEVAEEGKNACLTWLLPGGNKEFVTPKYADIQRLLNPTTVAIYWHTSPVALTTFIIRSDSDEPKVIEQQPEETNTEKPETPEGTHCLQRLKNWLRKWDEDYRNSRKSKDDKSEAQSWRDQLANRLKELADILNIPKILAELKPDNEIKQIILFPHQDLHRLPLEALFPDDFTLIRLPSVQMGLHLQQNCRNTGNTPSTTPTLLGVQPPNSEGLDDLPYAEMESTAVCHLFDSHTSIASHEVTREKLAQQLTSGYRIFHFSGHAEHEPLHPKLSQLYLTGSDTLKLQEICGLCLQGYDLVTLSACETAIAANQTITTEYVGLVSAFLYGAGVAHVLSTLWTVESEATAILTLKFYTLFLAGESAPRAIAIAKQWLRDATWDDVVLFYQELADSLRSKAPKAARLLDRAVLRINRQVVLTDQPFKDPYHWSAFAITGLPMSAPE